MDDASRAWLSTRWRAAGESLALATGGAVVTGYTMKIDYIDYGME
jgi:hypothetical protein